jgi:hypothetical protein
MEVKRRSAAPQQTLAQAPARFDLADPWQRRRPRGLELGYWETQGGVVIFGLRQALIFLHPLCLWIPHGRRCPRALQLVTGGPPAAPGSCGNRQAPSADASSPQWHRPRRAGSQRGGLLAAGLDDAGRGGGREGWRNQFGVESTAARCARSAAGEAEEVDRCWGLGVGGGHNRPAALLLPRNRQVNCLPI